MCARSPGELCRLQEATHLSREIVAKQAHGTASHSLIGSFHDFLVRCLRCRCAQRCTRDAGTAAEGWACACMGCLLA